jgi:hypothetical protein
MSLAAHKSILMRAIDSGEIERVESLIRDFRFDDRWAYRVDNPIMRSASALLELSASSR